MASLAIAGPAMAHLSIGDRVFNDVNNNGRFDFGEPGIAGVTVNGYEDLNGDCVPEGTPLQTSVTNVFGSYMLAALGQGVFVVELDRANFAAGGPLAGFTSSTGSPLNVGPYEPGLLEATGLAGDNRDHGTLIGGRVRACPIELRLDSEPVGEGPTPDVPAPDPVDANVNSTIDFGMFKPRASATRNLARPSWTVGDRVWNDLDRDGVQDRGEPGVGNARIRVINSSGRVIGSVRTAANGRWSVSGFKAGRYRFAFDPPPGGGRLTRALQGRSRAQDSNPNPRTRRTGLMLLRGGIRITHVDAGMILPTSVSGQVWRDTNGNRRVDRAEALLRGIRVRISGKGVRRTVRTNAAGKYTIARLPRGVYRITFIGLPTHGGPSTPMASYTASTATTRPFGVLTGRQRQNVNLGLLP